MHEMTSWQFRRTDHVGDGRSATGKSDDTANAMYIFMNSDSEPYVHTAGAISNGVIDSMLLLLVGI